MSSVLGSERVAILAALNPVDIATTASSTSWIAAANFFRFMGVVQVGAITGTVDAKFQQATTSTGTGAKDVTGKSITQVAATGDNRQAVINCRHDDLDIDGGFDYIRLTVTPTGGTTNLAAALLLGIDGRATPASDYNATSVAEVIS